MSYVVRVVCDSCDASPVGFIIQPGRTFARLLDRALPNGWHRVVTARGDVEHTCPKCQRAPSDAKEGEG